MRYKNLNKAVVQTHTPTYTMQDFAIPSPPKKEIVKIIMYICYNITHKPSPSVNKTDTMINVNEILLLNIFQVN